MGKSYRSLHTLQLQDVKDTLSRRIMNDLEYNTYQSLNKESKKIYFFEVWTSKEAYIKKLGTSITLNPSNISIEEDVLLKKINISSNEYMIALTNALSITIDERYIPKELLERNK